MLAPVVHLLALTNIRRERVLPPPAKVLVRKGQRVGANDVIVEANLYPGHLLLDIAAGLGVSESQADRYLQVKPGERLAEGDIIAGPVGLGRRVVRAPGDCQVILAGSAQVLLELSEGSYQVKAGMSGEVSELIPDRGAIIETTGALVQGNWGNDRIDFGVMIVLADTLDQLLRPDQLDVSMRGSIVLAARCEDVESLQIARDLPVRGLILASMPIGLMPVAEKMEYPIILIEGFGNLPMNALAFKLLSTNERREVSLNAQRWDLFDGERPEIVIPLPGETETAGPRETEVFAPNQQVRVVRAPYASKIGRVVRLRRAARFPTGLQSDAAEVQFEDGEIANLPLANLEVIA